MFTRGRLSGREVDRRKLNTNREAMKSLAIRPGANTIRLGCVEGSLQVVCRESDLTWKELSLAPLLAAGKRATVGDGGDSPAFYVLSLLRPPLIVSLRVTWTVLEVAIVQREFSESADPKPLAKIARVYIKEP